MSEIARGLSRDLEAVPQPPPQMSVIPSSDGLTRFHQRLVAEELTGKQGDAQQRVVRALSEAKVDLNPHQLEAAVFAIDSLPRGGCMLADEVGLGKTIEAGMVLSQLVSEGKSRILVLAPATLRAQWQQELKDKFDLESAVVDGRTVRATGNCFDQSVPIVIASHPFAANRSELLAQITWDLVVIDEAHRLRNAHKPGNKTGKALKAGLRNAPKLLLTATPLQNDLSELFGLISLLDEQILGPEEAFRAHFPIDPEHGGLTEAASRDIKQRLAPVVQRTLRRQVREYVRYTNRRSVVEDFTPLPEEQALYDDVSEYLRRNECAAIEPGKRTLLTMVYRKLLASSTYAIAPTLRRLAESLEKRLEYAKLSKSGSALLFEPEETKQYVEEAEEWSDDPTEKPHTLDAMKREVWELQQFANRADKIRVNSKGEALKRAIDRVFTVARAHQWPEKAVIFTESKRTLEYLDQLLSGHGFAGKIAKLTGDAGTPEARRALVEDFRNRAQILLSTEAGAEGLNLQFCNLVVNYDLPWNPQRVEQRIGRCHRYGQARDVLVLNFLNRSNAADARLYELLEKKLNLFDGVFGASDEILGALENGVDFEKRVLEIYQSCRMPEDINAAFDALRKDLESRIDQRMTETRSLLIERFDGEVRKRLRLATENAKAALKTRKANEEQLTGAVLGKAVTGRKQLQLAAKEVRSRVTDAASQIVIDGSTLPSTLDHLQGKEGWWYVYRFEISGLKPEEKLVHLLLYKHGESFRVVPWADGEGMARAQAKEISGRTQSVNSPTLVHEQAIMAAKDEITRIYEKKSVLEFDATRDRADRFAEDSLFSPRQQVDRARAEWEEARLAVLAIEDPAERVKPRATAERLEREYRRKLQQLRQAEDTRYAEKDRTLAAQAQKAKVVTNRALVASTYFWVE
ncbi:MAG: DEAD/DEAH box helicase family protein [Archangiaceae bacterium]|nr:DEAD/DEAH box helicase family protein [Archangiaceae bacterium]